MCWHGENALPVRAGVSAGGRGNLLLKEPALTQKPKNMDDTLDPLIEDAISEFRNRCLRFQREQLWGPVEIKAVYQAGVAEIQSVGDNMTTKRNK